MCVDHRRLHVAVPEQLLDRANVIARFQQMRGEAMPQRVRPNRFRDSNASSRFANGSLGHRLVEVMPAPLAQILARWRVPVYLGQADVSLAPWLPERELVARPGDGCTVTVGRLSMEWRIGSPFLDDNLVESAERFNIVGVSQRQSNRRAVLEFGIDWESHLLTPQAEDSRHQQLWRSGESRLRLEPLKPLDQRTVGGRKLIPA